MPLTSFHPYLAYKSSCLNWLGDVPAHWEVRRLRSIATILNGATPSTSVPAYWDGGIQWITPEDLGHLQSRHICTSARSITREGYESCGATLAPSESIAISTRAPVGHIGILKSAGCVNQGCRLLVPHRGVQSDYLYYSLAFARAELQSLGQGSTFTELSGGKLGDFRIPLPPLPEQQAVVRYLDHIDRRIRRYVAAKRKLIALLEEEKQAVIDRTVTRGLDPSARLKPSGVDWLGDVPEHWEVRRLGYLATKFGSGITPRGGATVYQEHGVPFLRSQNIHFEGLRMEGVARIAADLHQELSGSHVEPGDVLLNITGASIGRVCSVPKDFAEGNVNQHVCIIRPIHGRLLSGLLAAYLSTPAMQREIQFEQSGASREGLTLQSIRNFKVIAPPFPEQAVIVDYLGKATADIDYAIARSRRQIELIEEYRTRLIADVVTGKLDVREAAAQLPDQADQDEDPLASEDSPPGQNLDGDPGEDPLGAAAV